MTPTPQAVRPCGFLACTSCFTGAYLQDVVRRVIHDRVLRGHVPYPQRTFYSQPGRVSYSRLRSWDLILRRFALVCRVDGVFRLAFRAHMPFRLVFRRACF